MAIQRGIGGITHRPTRMAIANRTLNNPTFADVAGQAQVNTTAAMTFVIDGKILSKAAADIPLTGVNEDGSFITAQSVNSICLYLLAINAGGTMFAIKSAEEVAFGVDPTRYPYLPDRLELTAGTYTAMDLCVCGSMLVNTVAAWTAGTSPTNTPTITYVSLSQLPSAY